jgi:hypothetical protein
MTDNLTKRQSLRFDRVIIWIQVTLPSNCTFVLLIASETRYATTVGQIESVAAEMTVPHGQEDRRSLHHS